MLDGIDFGMWKIEYNVFKIDDKKPLKEQIWELNEDILQATYIDSEGNNYLLDIGWYPEFNVRGHFIIYIIKNYDWENPLVKQGCTISNFRSSLQKCINDMNN